MHQEYGDVIEFQFDDQALDARVEIMEALAANARRRQKSVGLLAHDRHQMIDRCDAILALVGRVVAQRAGNEIGLIDHSGADGAGVHFDEADDIRVLLLDEIGDARQHLPAGAKIAGAGHRAGGRRARSRWHNVYCKSAIAPAIVSGR